MTTNNFKAQQNSYGKKQLLALNLEYCFIVVIERVSIEA
jgi:hypothetical protein